MSLQTWHILHIYFFFRRKLTLAYVCTFLHVRTQRSYVCKASNTRLFVSRAGPVLPPAAPDAGPPREGARPPQAHDGAQGGGDDQKPGQPIYPK